MKKSYYITCGGYFNIRILLLGSLGSGDELTQSATFYKLEFFRYRPDFNVELTLSVWKTCVEDPVIDDWMRLVDHINAL
jgi:hypothetical protein